MSPEILIQIIILIAIILYTLKYETLSMLIFSIAFFYYPLMLILLIVETISGFPLYVAIPIIIIATLILGYFFVEFPFDEDLHNQRYIEEVRRSNSMLASFQSEDNKTQGMIAWIGDGIPLEEPKRISSLQQIKNRVIFYLKDYVLYKLLNIYHFFKWEYGNGGDIESYNRIHNKHYYSINKKIEANHDEIYHIFSEMKDTKLSNERFIGFLFLSFVLTYALTSLDIIIKSVDVISPSKFEYYIFKYFNDYYLLTPAVITASIFLLYKFQKKYLRNYIDGANAKFQLLKRYINLFSENDKFIVFTWITRIDSKNSYELVVGSINYDYYHLVEDSCIITHNGINYIAIEPNISSEIFYNGILPLIKERENFDRWINVLAEKKAVNTDCAVDTRKFKQLSDNVESILAQVTDTPLEHQLECFIVAINTHLGLYEQENDDEGISLFATLNKIFDKCSTIDNVKYKLYALKTVEDSIDSSRSKATQKSFNVLLKLGIARGYLTFMELSDFGILRIKKSLIEAFKELEIDLIEKVETPSIL